MELPDPRYEVGDWLNVAGDRLGSVRFHVLVRKWWEEPKGVILTYYVGRVVSEHTRPYLAEMSEDEFAGRADAPSA